MLAEPEFLGVVPYFMQILSRFNYVVCSHSKTSKEGMPKNNKQTNKQKTGLGYFLMRHCTRKLEGMLTDVKHHKIKIKLNNT